MATVVNARDVLLAAAAVRIIPTTIGITSPAGAVTFIAANDLSSINPASLTLNSNVSSLPAASIQWYTVVGGVDTIISGATSITYTLSSAQFLTDVGSGTSVIYKAIGTVGGMTASSTITVYLVKNGATGPVSTTPGPAGPAGASNHRCYIAATTGSPPSTPGTTTSGAAPAGWSLSPVSVSTGQSQYQSDGITPSGSTTTTWGTPYLSYFKVGNLEAITVNTGNLSVTGELVIGSSGSIKGGKVSYSDTAPGFFLGYDSSSYKFHVGNSSQYLRWTGSGLEIQGNITGTSNIDITGTSIFRGTSTVLGSNYSAIGVSGISGVGGLWGIGTNAPGVSGNSNVTAMYGFSTGGSGTAGVIGQGYHGVWGFTTGGSGAAVFCDGDFRWGTRQYIAPTGTGTAYLRDDGVWATPSSGLAFTPVQQGGGGGQLSNKIYIGWLGSSLGVQIDSSNYSSTWPISINGNAATVGTYTISDIITAMNTAINNNNSSYVTPNFIQRSGSTFSLYVPSLGATYTNCQVF